MSEAGLHSSPTCWRSQQGAQQRVSPVGEGVGGGHPLPLGAPQKNFENWVSQVLSGGISVMENGKFRNSESIKIGHQSQLMECSKNILNWHFTLI